MTFRPTLWTGPISVTPLPATLPRIRPDITRLTNGNFLVTWRDNGADTGSPGADVFGRLYDAEGAAIGAEFQVNRASQADDEGPAVIGALPGGGFVAAYLDTDGATTAIRFDIRNAAGAFVRSGTVVAPVTAPAQVRDLRIADATDGLSADGFALVWEQARVITVGGVPVPVPEVKFQSFTTAGDAVAAAVTVEDFKNDQAVAHLSTGRYVVATLDDVASLNSDVIRLTTYTRAGAVDTSALAIDEFLFGGAGRDLTQIGVAGLRVAGGNGNAEAAVWAIETRSGADRLLMWQVLPGNVVGSPAFVTISPSAQDVRAADITGLRDGGWFIAWSAVVDGNFGIFGQRFNADGSVAGSTLIIATGAGILKAPALSLTGDGRILVAWDDTGRMKSAIFDPRDALIRGTAGDDVLLARRTASTLEGFGGQDDLRGSLQDDLLDGGLGNDRLTGGAGNDTLLGGTGISDTASYVFSAAGVTLSLQGGPGSGGDAAGDLLTGIENLTGSIFDDVLTGDNALTRVNRLDGQAGNDRLAGGGGQDSLFGGAGNDTLLGGTEGDRLDGGTEDDRLQGGAGADSLTGGAGNDTADYTGSATGVTVRLFNGTGQGGDAQGDVLAGVEHVIGSANPDNLIGADAQANSLNGGAGSDFLSGMSGNDTLDSGAGNDTLDGAAGNDTLDGAAGNDTLDGGAGNDSLIGGEGQDSADYGAATVGVAVRLDLSSGGSGPGDRDRLAGIEHVIGSALDDDVVGDGLDNRIQGGGGNDTLAGGNGNDTLAGEGGNDTLFGDSGADRLDGGLGVDTVNYSPSATGVTVRLFNGTGQGGDAQGDTLAGIERIVGSGLGDNLIGADTQGDALFGGAGGDFLAGLAGNDTLEGGTGADTLRGGAGADRLDGGANDDIADYAGSASVTVRLFNGTGEFGDAQGDVLAGVEHVIGSANPDSLIGADAQTNSLNGGGGGDFLAGLSGNDTLDGAAGNDTLDGGAGNDVFVFGPGTGADRVTLFQDGADRVDLVGLTFGQFTEGAIAGGVRLTGTGAAAGLLLDLMGVTTAQVEAGDFI